LLFEFNVAMVANVSPNWTKIADKVANSSGDLSFAMLHANIEINVTNSQLGII